MNTPRLILAATASLLLVSAAQAQTPAPTGTAPAPKAAAPKAFSAADQHIYLTVADSVQFHLNMALRMRGKYKEGPADMLALAGKISKECTELWTPGVDVAMSHGVDGKKIPQTMSKADSANLAKLNAIKDDKKWEVAFFEFFAKEAKKGAAEAEKGAKAAQSPDLKPFVEKAAVLLKSQADEVEAKFKELKARK